MRNFLGFPIAAASSASVPFDQMQQPDQRAPLYARLFDRINPGADGMNDADKQAAFRQGLLGLAAGMASTGGQGTMAALGNGLQSGLLSMNTARADHLDRQMQQERMAQGLNDPAGFREFELMTDGLSEEEKARARRVRLGIEGRASSAGMGFGTFTDANGYPRPQRNNPRTGEVEIWFDEQGQWVPLGAASGSSAALPTPPGSPHGQTTFMGPDGMPIQIGDDLPEHVRQQIIADPNSWNSALDGSVASLPAITRPASAPAPTGLGRGRRPEEQAAAVTAAQQAAELQYLPTRQAIEAQGAGMREENVQDARTASERRAEFPLARASMGNAIDGLQRMAQTAREVRDNPALGRITGVMGQIPDMPGSEAANVRAQLENTLRSQVGFGVLQAMRDASKTGGALGQVSNIENILLQENLAALANTQSDEALRQELDKIIEYAEGAQQRLRNAFDETYKGVVDSPAAPHGGGQRRLRYNPQTGRLE